HPRRPLRRRRAPRAHGPHDDRHAPGPPRGLGRPRDEREQGADYGGSRAPVPPLLLHACDARRNATGRHGGTEKEKIERASSATTNPLFFFPPASVPPCLPVAFSRFTAA